MREFMPTAAPGRRRGRVPSVIWVTDDGLRAVSAFGALREELRAAERSDWPLTRWAREAGGTLHVLEVLARGGTIVFTAVLHRRAVDVHLSPHTGTDGRRGAIGMAYPAD